MILLQCIAAKVQSPVASKGLSAGDWTSFIAGLPTSTVQPPVADKGVPVSDWTSFIAGLSATDWISLISAVATVGATIASIIAIRVSTRQFRLAAQQSRSDRQDEARERIVDASAARQLRFDDAQEARQLRQDDAKEAREVRLEEARKNWLLAVIIQPSLPTISAFYASVISTTIIALDDLINNSAHHASGSQKMKDLRVQRAGQINNLKQEFDHSFIILVATQNYIFGQKLRTSLNELEDLIVEEIGKIDYSQVDKHLLSEQLYEHKSKFFSILYQEVQQESR